jgi:molecular chaperone GrpE
VQVSIDAAELEQLRKDAAEYKDKSLRLLAEMDNTRKRMQKEKQELTQFAVQNVIVDFLHPIDHLENALSFTENMTGEVKNWAQGFQMILTQFKDVLASNGVVAYKSEGTPFDPHLHEAVEMVVTDQHPSGTVISESVKGYKMGDRVIRPARVKVAK